MANFLRTNFLVLFLLNSGNLFNYLFQLVIARQLTPTDFGTFNAINSIAIILLAPSAVLPVVFSRYTVTLLQTSMGQVRDILVRGMKFFTWITLGLLGLCLLGLPGIKSYLHLTSTLPLVLMLVQFSLSMVRPILFGVIQGLQRFTLYGLGSSSIPLVRFVSGLVFVIVLDWGVNGAVFSGVVGAIVAMVIGFWGIRDVLNKPNEPIPPGLTKEMGRYGLPAFGTACMVMVLGNLDIVFVRHYCTPEEAGFYATAAILGRIAMFLPGVLTHVLFPVAAQAHEDGEKGSSVLWTSLGLTALLGGGFALLCALWPEMIISLLFGSKYIDAAPMLVIISIAMALLAIANVVFTYSLARSEFGYLWPLAGGVLLMLFLIFLFHDSALTIAVNVLWSVSTILLGTMGWYLAKNLRPRTEP